MDLPVLVGVANATSLLKAVLLSRWMRNGALSAAILMDLRMIFIRPVVQRKASRSYKKNRHWNIPMPVFISVWMKRRKALFKCRPVLGFCLRAALSGMI